MRARELLSGLLDLLYPPLCILCGEPTGGPSLCERCKKELPTPVGLICATCGKPLKSCVCTGWPWGFVRATSCFSYRDGVRRCLLGLKEETDFRAVRFFGEQMYAQVANAYGDVPFDLVVPVPMNPKKLRSRGHNHAALLAREISKHLGVPLREDCLIRLDSARIQHELDAAARGENAWLSYRAAPGCQFDGETVLLVDDIMTTGATLHWCAQRLLEVGVGKVYCVTTATTEA